MAKKKFHVHINDNFCKRCGICYWICPTKTIIKGELGKPEVPDHDKCIGCLMCENACPDFAIDVVEREAVKKDV
ncbi:MAG: ferredoxin [Thermotogae bacterium]|uniref:4Fe-4S dicluster domain-containing protein n=1 Tax=Kosmotoga sp. TaxID=1955248 RepID=UPI000F225CBC|nr:4Fe-4S binding protein [Kosmotoga sp.]MBO8167123.1 4Fe-4S binding protein [Kosmotoga sp.]MCD6159818.1 4Fe-4S binding protein [Kosmotoga sp.]RKX49591.1 MAG: ferredoxin [Thermotogota bacterium]